MYWATWPTYDYEIFQRDGGVSWRAVNVWQTLEEAPSTGFLYARRGGIPRGKWVLLRERDGVDGGHF